MKKVKELTISRAIWLRGEGSNKSALLRSSDGKMCCLGIYLLACGAIADDIVDEGDPNDAYHKRLDELPSWMLVGTSVSSLMETNDDRGYEDTEREQRIRDGFAEVGVSVQFVD